MTHDEEVLEALEDIAEGTRQTAKALKGKKQPAPSVTNHVHVPQLKTPDVKVDVSAPSVNVQPSVVNVLHPMWKGRIKVVRHANGTVDYYDMIPASE